MTSKRNRVIAFLLAASLFMNTAVLPARAEEVTPPTEYPEITEPAPTQEPAPAATEAPTEAPTQAPTEASTEETLGTEAATEAPTEETQAPTQETEGPTEETQEVTQPTEETQAPTEETQEATEPTEETTVPDEEALWAAQEAGYLLGIRHYSTLPVTGERNMPLEWWYVLTGQAAMREPDPDSTPEETEPAEDPETTQDWGRYLVFPESIVVHSARELTLLSYVWPGEYHQRTITLLADAGAEFDLTAPAAIHQGTEAEQALGFQGLGGLDYPFGGTLRFGVQSGDIYFVLSSPLFNGILCQTRFVDAENQPNPIRLVSKAEYSFDGLLAVHVLGEESAPAYWNVQLLAPDTENGGQFCLPSLLGILYAGANMNLSLTDMSRLAPAARGYLCAVMYRHAALRATNITREISVPLVGQLDAEATLITDAPSAQPTEAPTEEATEAPTEEATEAPTVEATEAPTEEATEAPTEEATEAPTGEATEAPTEAPTEEATQPESVPDGAALLEMAIAFYQAMEVVPGEMSLEWWYAVTGQALPGTVQAELVVNGEEFLRYLEENQIPLPTLPTESLPEEPTAPQEDTASTQEATLPQETAQSEETSGPEETAPGEEAADPAGNNTSDEIINEESTSFPEAGAVALAGEGDTASVHSDDADSTQGMYAVAAYGALEDAGFTESGDTISINSTQALIQLSYVDAGAYQDKNLVLLWNAGGNAVFETDTPSGESTFQGLGSEAAPFRGTIGMQTGSENVPIQLARPLFNAVADSAGIGNLNLKSAVTGTAHGLLAKVVTAGNGTKTWAVTLVPHTDTEKTYVLPALLGTMRSDSNVTLQVTDNAGLTVSGSGYLCAAMENGASLTVESLGSIPAVINAADAAVGGLVGTMGSGASLTVGSLDGCTIDVTSVEGSAGGLVGKMEDGAALTVSSAVTIGSITGKGYTGGIAGECTNPVFTFTGSASLTGANNPGQIYSSGGRAVGGIAGKLTWSSDNSAMAALPISNLLITNGDAGGLYGEVNASKALVFSYNGSLFTNVMLNSRNLNGSGDEGAGALGGLIGWFHGTYGNITVEAGTVIEVTMGHGSYIGGLIGAPDCEQAAIITLSGQITLHGSDTSVNVGGVIGGSSTKEMRVACSNLTVAIDGFDKFAPTGNYGGLIGKIANPSYVYVGENVNLSGTKIIGTGAAGGLIGTLDSGVLYLGENPVLPTESSASNVNQRGWIVGNRGNALVCAAKDWAPSHNADYQMNDTNPWGQVLQLTKFDSNLIQLNTENRTVTVGNLPAMLGNSYAIGSLTDFAAVALRMQLNPAGALQFDGDFGKDAAISLVLNADIDLNGTGLTGLTRNISTTDAFSVTLDGGGHTITLPGERVYASGNSHNRLGLIGKVEALSLSNLSIAGNCQTTVLAGGQIYTGIACDVTKNATLEKVTSGLTWTIDGNSGNSRHSGMVTQLSKNYTGVTYTDCTWSGTITDNTSADSEIAGFLAHLETGRNKITVTNCALSGTIYRPASTGQARVGGLVACLNGSDTKLTIDGLTVSTHITAKAPQYGWTDSCGGLLGYGWKKTTATFTGVTINGSTLDTDRKFGGLVYNGSGYWKLTEGNGINFTGSNQFTGTSDNGTPSALLVSTSYETGLYLEVLHDSFRYNENETTVRVDVGGTDRYFDALMGKSIYGDGQDSIVSIATAPSSDSAPHRIDLADCNTYRTPLSNTYENPCTRYDYNLDSFNREGAADAIDTPEEMVLWSVYRRCHNSLRNYFSRGSGTKITGDMDLTGYAFYPAPYDGTNLENATITFAFQELENVEGAASNKKPSDTQRQHAGMHTGIFTGVGGNGTLSVTKLTLKGTVGGYDGSYGAIIRGSAQGADKDHLRTLAIHGVTLDGIQIYPGATKDTVAPLLIGSLGSFTTLNLSGVKVTAGSYLQGAKAASSLIGSAGNADADYIQLTFSDMHLSETDEKNNPSTLFTRGLFLETFRYSGNNCRGVYNFERNDDYTLGQEISNTEGGLVSGRNNGEQYWFFRENDKETGYVCTTIDGNDSSAAPTAFQEYPRYVAKPEGGNAATYHEIDVNLVSPDLLIGCGTYSHPYLITNGRQLEALSQAILAGGSRSGWRVKVSNPVMANKQDFSQQGDHTRTGSDEEEDVLDGETVYVSSSQNWTGLGVESTCKDSAMLKYLCNAYYQIVGEITLSTWSGLGESSADKQFSGVLVGKDGAKVILSGTRTAAQFGGLVKFSRGCVVKDLAIVYQNDCAITLQCYNVPSDLANASFFGGVVGWCVGGDTVIDNVTVTYSGTVTAAGDKAHLAAFGGYVGLVGGANDQAGGGVIFRNISGGTTGFTPNYGYYSNPYIGRVLDGFALSENSWLGNPTDNYCNYCIPQITAAGISTNGSQVTVSDAAGLWVLSAWVNSRGGSAGKPRAGDYSKIGTPVSREFLTDEASGSTPYLARNFDCAYSGPLCLTLTADCDMSPYGNGFRGIGASCGENHPKLELKSLDGGNHTVTLQQDIRQYLDERDSWLFVSGGLFPDPVFSAPSTTVSNLTVSGKMHLYYTDAAQKIVNSWDAGQAGAGLLIGKSLGANNSLELTSVWAKDAEVMSNAQYVGGLIGRLQSWGGHNLTIQTCGYEAVTVSGYQNVGGLIGGYDGNFNGSRATLQDISCSGGTIQVPKEYRRGMNNSDLFGTGGLVGYLSAGNSTICRVSLNGENEIHNDGIYTGAEVGIGALVGLWCPRSSAVAENITITGALTIAGNNRSSIGCLGGYVCRQGDVANWGNNSEGIQFTATGIYIGKDVGSNISITGHQVGGLVGMYKSGAQGTNLFTIEQIHQQNITLTGNTVGGLVAVLCKAPAVIASNIFLTGNQITGQESIALFFARTDNQVANAHPTIDVKNVEATGCTVASTNNQNSNVGFLYGQYKDTDGKGSVNGYNILISGSSITGTNKAAIWGGGNAKNTPVRLVAVCLQNCTAPAKDFAAGDSCYAIRANYTGVKQEVGDAPYIPGNPQSPLVVGLGTSPFTGDGASWADAGTEPMGKKIRDEVATGDCNTYFNAQGQAAYFVSNDFITDYAARGDNGELSSDQVNFPVLVVPADTRQKVTEEISNYITLLTNEKNWRSVVSAVEIHTYQWKDSGFERLTDTDTSLSWNGQQFAVTKGCHDNQRNQFTMLDVQFTAGSENCYHLYIPVIVRKELEFRFWVAAEVGTNYYVSAYDSLSTPAIGSHGEPVTALIGFEYLRSQEEWQAAVDSGENLLWSFVKELTLNPGSGATALPEGTKLALVERGNANKAYFCQGSFGTSLPFSSFEGWEEAQHPSLCDGLGLTAQESETGLYVKTQPENATLRIGEDYYKIPEGTETGTDGKKYAITVQATENLREEYYLTILTPDNAPITNFTITQSSKLQGNLPTKLVNNEGGKEFTRKDAENQIILANFFTQKVSVTTTNSNLLMSGSNNTIGATLTATIGFADARAAQLFRDYGSSKQLHQRFDLVLKLCQGDSVTQTSLASGTTLQVTYRKNGTEISTATVPVSGSAAKLTFPDGIQVSDLTGDLTLEAQVLLTYTDPGILQQFPTRGSEDTTTGILVCANSYLAYSAPSLAQSSSPISAADSNKRRYYRQKTGATRLHYVATGSNRLNQLGINALESGEPAAIDSSAQYVLSSLNAATQAATLRCTVTLQRKTDDGDYQDATVPFHAAIGATVVGSDGITHEFPAQKEKTVDFALPKGIDNSIPIQIPVTLSIGTGSALENAGGYYANYRVVLTAQLLNRSGTPIPNSQASDYIVYTNAKIVTELIR